MMQRHVSDFLRRIRRVAVALTLAQGLALGVTPVACAAPAADLASTPANLSFATLGAFEPIHLRGTSDTRALNLGVRLDRVVTHARLHLVYTYSPSLIFALSHLKVSVNGEAVATLPFDREHAGRQVTQDIDIDPRYFAGFNRIALELVAHYTDDHCEDPAHSSLWADISPTSEVVLDQMPLALPNDLARLPAPFFDRRDNARLSLPFVLGRAPTVDTLRAAGIVASWLGTLADYRPARFTARQDLPPDDHAIVVGLPADVPAGVTVPALDGPTLMMTDNPRAPTKKLLLVLGRDAHEVRQAAYALVLGKAALTGARATVAALDLGPPRKPYDAPTWLPVDRPVRLRELVRAPGELESAGATGTIRVNLRVPADLFAWTGRGVPLNLRYRYTAPSVVNDSSLTVDINDQLVKSFRLRPASAQSGNGRLQLPLLSGDAAATDAISVPAFRVGSNNQMQLHFQLDSQKTGLCSGTPNPARASVDPDSTIDFSGFAHRAMLPNLAYFANSGYPFTRLADLAQTAVVIPDQPTPGDLTALLTVFGHFGAWTGLPALRAEVVPASRVRSVAQDNLLLVGGGSARRLLATWHGALPLSFSNDRAEVRLGDGLAFDPDDNRHDDADDAGSGGVRHVAQPGRALFNESGPLGMVLGFESPLKKKRSVIAVTATDDQALGGVLDALEDSGKVARMRGDVAVVRAGTVEPMRLGPTYVVGDFPWYALVWMRISTHPIVLALIGLLGGIAAAIGAFVALQRIAERRRGGP